VDLLHTSEDGSTKLGPERIPHSVLHFLAVLSLKQRIIIN